MAQRDGGAHRQRHGGHALAFGQVILHRRAAGPAALEYNARGPHRLKTVARPCTYRFARSAWLCIAVVFSVIWFAGLDVAACIIRTKAATPRSRARWPSTATG